MSPISSTLANASARGYRSFAAAAAPAFESIASFNASGGETGFTFSSIPQTYSSLQIRYTVRTTSGGENVRIRPNSVSTAIYTNHRLNGDGSTVTAAGFISETLAVVSENTDSTYLTVGVIDIHEYASTTQNKTIRVFTGTDLNGTGGISLRSSLFASTTAITSLQFLLSGSTFRSFGGTTFSLYGIKGA
jgi:hypothetical protein